MRRKFAELQRIEGGRTVTKESDYEFFYQLQYALLLALKERGTMTTVQFQIAEKRLKEQRHNRAGKMMVKGNIT